MDLISRQDAIDYCYQLINVEHEQGSDEMNYGQERVNQTETILHHLEFMPSAEPKQKTGKWITKNDTNHYYTTWWYECSECGQYPPRDGYGQEVLSDYCPHCGCRMVGEEE